MLKKPLCIITCCLALATNSFAETLTIAAASDMTYCLPELTKTFQAENPGSDVKTLFGASGSLFAQIQHGAPFDVFMSADMQYPTQLVTVGAAEKESLFAYARGHLMLWAADPKIDLAEGIASLRQVGISRIAMANPETAPYGRAARAALQQSNLWDELKPRLVFGDNISQTLQYAETGNAQVAFLSRSLLSSPKMIGKGRGQALPETLYPPINQGLVITRVGVTNPLSTKFARFMKSEQARMVLVRYGFSIPDKAR